MKASFSDITIWFRLPRLLLSVFSVLLLTLAAFADSPKKAFVPDSFSPITYCASSIKPEITSNGPTTLCAGGSVLLTASSGKAYKWNTGATTPSITVTRSGTYNVEVTDENGCVGKSDDVVVRVAGSLNAPTIAYTEPLILCNNGSVRMSVPVQEGASYVWKKDGRIVYDGSNEYTARESGTYTVELSNFCGGVRSLNEVEINIQQPIPSFKVEATGNTSFCKGGSVKLSVPEYKEVTYTWYRDGIQIGGSSREQIAGEAGNYSAKITNKCGTYSSTNEQRVEVLALPKLPTVKHVSSCGQTAITLTATGGSVGMYRWYREASGGTAIAGADGPSFTTPVLTASATYYVSITNGHCESQRIPAEAIINTMPMAPEIAASGDLQFCEGGSVELSVRSYQNLQYVWLRDGQEVSKKGNKLQVTESGEYTVQVQNECGTSFSTNKVTVKVWPIPVAPTVQDGSTCGAGKVKLIAKGGVAGEYRWYENATITTALAGFTGGTFTTPELQSSQTYYVSLVRNGCESKRVPVQAIVNPAPQAIANVQDIEIDAGESTQLTGNGGASYSWSPADGLNNPILANPVATPEQTTRYTLTVKNTEGCEDTTSVVVTVHQLLEIPNAFSPNGDGINDTWDIKNIEFFPGTKVEVYNRWGNLIFERTNYRSEWNGTYRGTVLPVSPYFYIVTVPGKRKFTGYVNIVN